MLQSGLTPLQPEAFTVTEHFKTSQLGSNQNRLSRVASAFISLHLYGLYYKPKPKKGAVFDHFVAFLTARAAAQTLARAKMEGSGTANGADSVTDAG
jgi:hypothetical protein